MTITETSTSPAPPTTAPSTDATALSEAPVTHDDWVALAHEIGADLASDVAENDRTGEISHEAFDRLRAEGVTAALVPSELGGAGIAHATLGAVLRTIGRYDGPTAVTLSMHSHVLGTQVWRHHHGLDATNVFRAVVDRRAVLISTGASDWVSSSGSVRQVEGGYRVSARKMPASGCEVGDVAATSFRWDDAPDGPQVIHCSVPTTADGVSIDLTWDTLGMRATGSHCLVFEDVFVPDAAVSLIRPADVWHPLWNIVLPTAMPLIMSAYLGIADAAVEEVRRVASGRSDAHVVQLVGEMVNAHTTADDAVAAMFAAADDLRFDNTDELTARTLARKTVASDAIIDTVRLGIEATGGLGYTRNSVLERMYRDVHGSLFHPLPRAKQTRFTGRVALGHSPIG
jgi:alkylation response protein AidB-like acyl-CoA dehydrogenase